MTVGVSVDNDPPVSVAFATMSKGRNDERSSSCTGALKFNEVNLAVASTDSGTFESKVV